MFSDNMLRDYHNQILSKAYHSYPVEQIKHTYFMELSKLSMLSPALILSQGGKCGYMTMVQRVTSRLNGLGGGQGSALL
jgi:hypothetical protein